jgi:VCBS repeat-containing protein
MMMLEARLSRGPQHGSLTLASDGSFTYTADRAYKGPDSFEYVLVTDGVISAPATVSITVTNMAPVLGNRTYEVLAGTALYANGYDVTGVLAGASDADGDWLTVRLLTSPEHGSLMLSEDGSFTYVPDAAFSGADTFQVVAFDGTDASAPATITLQVNPPDWSATNQSFTVHAGATLQEHLTADLTFGPLGSSAAFRVPLSGSTPCGTPGTRTGTPCNSTSSAAPRTEP